MASNRTRVALSLEDPSFDAFAEFAAVAYPDQPLSAAVREACLAYMGTDPLEAARVAARRAAWLEAQRSIASAARELLKGVQTVFTERVDAADAELKAMGN